jgi:small subunit ribosomal protein S15Ae
MCQEGHEPFSCPQDYRFRLLLELTFFFHSGYIGEFEEVDDHRNGKIVIQLLGRLNKTGVISPRYNIQLSEMEKWVVKLLPSRQFGYVVLTTC